jgi:histidine kinase/DNA gyrase B/HSP90-like ATPase
MAQLDRFGDMTAPAERILYTRAFGDDLMRDVKTVIASPIVDGIMQSAGGLFAVLNVYRQILAVNDSFLRYLGGSDGSTIIGLRPGEAIGCVHANDSIGGCGTGKFCVTCGAAVAIATSLCRDRPEERKCVAVVTRDETEIDVCFRVRATPYGIGGSRFFMLLLQDITAQERRAELEQVFSHEMGELVAAVAGASELLARSRRHKDDLCGVIHRNAMRLDGELKLWRALVRAEAGDYKPVLGRIAVDRIVLDLADMYATNPVAAGKKICLPEAHPGVELETDGPLLERVLANMLTNALEATEDNGEVRVWLDTSGGKLAFSVWNRQVIPQEIALRVFQRHFSTKAEYGRGIGTYIMKIFGEQILGGSMAFSSSEEEGTTFRFTLPVAGGCKNVPGEAVVA